MTHTANHAGSPRVVGKQRNCCPKDRQSVGAQAARRALRRVFCYLGAVALGFAIIPLFLWLATMGPAQTAAAQQDPVPTPVPDVSTELTPAPPGDTQPASPSTPGEVALPEMQPEAVEAVEAVAAGETHCLAIPAAQNRNYGTVQSMTNRYYVISVTQASRVYMTVTNATGQIQFRTPRSGPCPGGATTLIDYQPTVLGGSTYLRYFNVTPGSYYIRIATTTPGANQFTLRWSATPGYLFSEPNNTACAPRVINLNTEYGPLPENPRPDLNQGSGVGAENDFYRFTLGSQSLVQIQFGSYIAGQRQVQLRRGPCASTTLVDSTAYVANVASGTIQRTLPAGNYWVRFITLNGTQSRVKYSLRVTAGPAASNGYVDSCVQPSAHCDWQTDNPNDAYPPPATMYWWNMAGKQWLQLWLTGQDNAQCGRGSSGPSITLSGANLPANGAFRFTGVGNGYYHFSAKWYPPNPNGSDGDSKALKVNCTVLSATPYLLPEVLGPPGIVLVPSNTQPFPQEAPIPAPEDKAAPQAQPQPEPTLGPNERPTPIP